MWNLVEKLIAALIVRFGERVLDWSVRELIRQVRHEEGIVAEDETYAWDDPDFRREAFEYCNDWSD